MSAPSASDPATMILLPSGCQAGPPRWPSTSVSWRHAPGGDVQDVQLSPQGAQHPGAVRLVGQRAADLRRAGPALPDRGRVIRRDPGPVDRRGEGDPGAVRAPDRGPGSQRQAGERAGLTRSGHVDQVELSGAAGRPQERQRRTRGGVPRGGVGLAGGQRSRVAAGSADDPEALSVGIGEFRRLAVTPGFAVSVAGGGRRGGGRLVLVADRAPQRVDDGAAVGGDRRVAGDLELW